MRDFNYFFAKVKYKLMKENKEVISDYFRKAGMKIGSNCNICCNIMTTEPYLINIGNDVTISANVQLITHDNSVCKIYGNGCDLFGKITIGNNCFVGAGATILYGVSIPDNCIIGAGSVVSKSIKKTGYIYAGNPIREICSIEKWKNKIVNSVIKTKGFDSKKRKDKVMTEEGKWIYRKTTLL